jgi:hypothetical protein
MVRLDLVIAAWISGVRCNRSHQGNLKTLEFDNHSLIIYDLNEN